MATAYIFLAPGFEEIEAITPIDILRRAGVTVYTVGVSSPQVAGSHGVTVEADIDAANGFVLPRDANMVILPGGGAGTDNLMASEMVRQVLLDADARGLYIAAICAAPTVLEAAGLLRGKRATAFPASQPKLESAHVTGAPVEVDGTIITARSAGVALEFAHSLAELLIGRKKADEVVAGIYPAE